MKKPENKILNKILKELAKDKNVKAIYLFGSQVTGKAMPTSDVDICVITEKNISAGNRADIASQSSGVFDVSLFCDLPITMRFKILKEGQLLYASDKKFLHGTIVQTLREYFDFIPVIKRFAQAVGVSYG